MLRRLVFLGLLMSAAVGAFAQGPAPDALHAASSKVMYVNRTYRFRLALPAEWKGYTVRKEKWEGQSGTVTKATGPTITIRDPRWTEAHPYQDISIMVFTKAQWEEVEAEGFAVSAAPVPPSELGRNSKHVFALPPRFIGFTDALGQKEVGEWLQGKPLHAY